MIRVKTKEKVISIINSLLKLINYSKKEELKNQQIILAECKEIMDSINNCMAKEDEAVPFVHTEEWDSISTVENRIQEFGNIIKKMPAVYQIIFFPYKAEMWDSLESIWMACRKDSMCDCKVVPIPYYHYNASEDEWIYTYEGEKFPSYVPIVDYREYSLEEEPDVVFIHNPYDEYNRVTQVVSDYFSYNIKKYVKKLFYVPYYVTSGFVSEEHTLLSVYRNADYLVVQSQAFKNGLKKYKFDSKALVLGNPKIDHVIRLSKERKNVPVEWSNYLKNKKVIFLNTSLGTFLQDSDIYIKKLKYVFEMFKEREDVALIWRPHPLLQSTIESLRTEFLEEFLELKRWFLQEKIGIYDSTSDIMNAIALSDAYIGEQSSSVVNLFLAAGKPLFILDNYISDSFSEEETRRVNIWNTVSVDGETYATLWLLNGLFQLDNDKMQYKKLANRKEEPLWVNTIGEDLLVKDNYIYMVPQNTSDLMRYNIRTKEMECIWKEKEGKRLQYKTLMEYQDKIYYVPLFSKSFIEYNTKTKEVKEYEQPIEELSKYMKGQYVEVIYNAVQYEKNIWAVNLYSNQVLRYDMECSQYEILGVGEENNTYSALLAEDELIYLAEATTGNIVKWNKRTRQIEYVYEMPKEFQVFPNVQGRYISHYKMVKMGEQLYTLPFYSNGMVKVDLRTKKVSMVAKTFWKEALKSSNRYKPEGHGLAWFIKTIDEKHLLAQRIMDAAMLEINIENQETKIYYPHIQKDSLNKMLQNSDGFEKMHRDFEFSRKESKYYTLDGFIDDLVNDRLQDAMKRQKIEMQTMAVNLDGTCGEKVHEFMMKELERG